MFRNEVTIDKTLIKELSKKAVMVSLLVAILGVLFAIPFLILMILNPQQIMFVIGFIVFMSLGGIGLAQFIRILITNKRAAEVKAHLVTELLDDKVIIHTNKVTEQKEDVVFTYDQITSYHVSPHYIFIRVGKRYYFPLIRDENEQKIIEFLDGKGVIKQ